MQLTPEQMARLQRQLAAGKLPPGVVAMPQGSAPPGAVPLGPAMDTQHPAMSARAAQNPMAYGDEGIATIRSMSECNIPEEAQRLNSALSSVMKLDIAKADPDTMKKADQALGNGILVGITANRHCKQNLKKRTVVTFSKDEKLKAIDDEFKQIEKDAIEMKKAFEAKVTRAQELLGERWKYACKNHGLNPENRNYWIDEDAGTIEEVEVRCDECKGAKEIVKAREDAEVFIAELTNPKEEEDNDGKSNP